MRSNLVSSLLLSASVLAMAGQSALADDFVVNNAATTTQVIDGDDTITVTESGSITPPSGNDGILGTGSNNTATNKGTITTSGGGEGVLLENGAPGDVTGNAIVNDGTVTTAGSNAYGLNIDQSNNSTITNNGAVNSSGSSSYGIYNEYSDNTVVTNNKTITTNGSNAHGVLVDSSDEVTVVNNGAISATNPNAASSAIAGILNDSSTNSNVQNNGDITTGGYRGYGIWNDSSDNATITNAKTITTSGTNAYGIENDSSDNVTILNSGTITTTGQGGRGINNDASDVTITNDGTISTSGLAGNAIWSDGSGNNVAITNNGTLTTSGGSSYGINFSSSGTGGSVVNNGQINTGGSSSPGINVGVGVPIINRGTIATGGNYSAGINFWGIGATITNSGTIVTQGTASSALYSNQGSTVTNSGVLRSNGSFAIAAQFFNSNIFTNSGSIVSSNFQSIGLAGTGNVVNLHAPSYLGGAISLGSNNSVNIVSGASHSVLWDLSNGTMVGGAPNLSGPVPWYYDSGNQLVATFDPTTFSARFNQLGDMAGMLSRLGAQGLGQAGRVGSNEAVLMAYADPGSGAEAGDAFAAQPGLEEVQARGRFWSSAFGGHATHGGGQTSLDQDIALGGAVFGYGWQPDGMGDTQLSIMAGYMHSAIEAESAYAKAQDIKSDGVFVGVNGARSFGELTFGLGLAAGWQSHDSKRFVNDNLAATGGLTLGESHATASYDSWFIAPEASLSLDHELETGAVVTPSARIRYAFEATDGYAETGSNANATVAASTQSLIEGNLELAIGKQFGDTYLTGRAGYLFRSALGDKATNVTMLGLTNAISAETNDLSAGYLGLGADFALSDRVSFALDGQATFSDDITAFNGIARLTMEF